MHFISRLPALLLLFLSAGQSVTGQDVQSDLLPRKTHHVSAPLVQILNPPGHPPASPDYSHISIAAPGVELINIAGQVGLDDKTGKAAPTFQSQVKKALLNMDLCLDYVNVSKKDIISTTQYVVGLGKLSKEDSKARLATIVQWLNGTVAPPGALIGVEALALPELLFEFEVVAVRRIV